MLSLVVLGSSGCICPALGVDCGWVLRKRSRGFSGGTSTNFLINEERSEGATPPGESMLAGTEALRERKSQPLPPPSG